MKNNRTPSKLRAVVVRLSVAALFVVAGGGVGSIVSVIDRLDGEEWKGCVELANNTPNSAIVFEGSYMTGGADASSEIRLASVSLRSSELVEKKVGVEFADQGGSREEDDAALAFASDQIGAEFAEDDDLTQESRYASDDPRQDWDDEIKFEQYHFSKFVDEQTTDLADFEFDTIFEEDSELVSSTLARSEGAQNRETRKFFAETKAENSEPENKVRLGADPVYLADRQPHIGGSVRRGATPGVASTVVTVR